MKTPTLETCERLLQAMFWTDEAIWGSASFYWVQHKSGTWQLMAADTAMQTSQVAAVPAPTLDEILDALPARDEMGDRLIIGKHPRHPASAEYGVGYGPLLSRGCFHDNPTEALALLWLAVEKHTKLV